MRRVTAWRSEMLRYIKPRELNRVKLVLRPRVSYMDEPRNRLMPLKIDGY